MILKNTLYEASFDCHRRLREAPNLKLHIVS